MGRKTNIMQRMEKRTKHANCSIWASHEPKKSIEANEGVFDKSIYIDLEEEANVIEEPTDQEPMLSRIEGSTQQPEERINPQRKSATKKRNQPRKTAAKKSSIPRIPSKFENSGNSEELDAQETLTQAIQLVRRKQTDDSKSSFEPMKSNREKKKRA